MNSIDFARAVKVYIEANAPAVPRIYDNMELEPKPAEYMRISIQHNVGMSAQMGGGMWMRFGFIFVQVFTKLGVGTDRSDVLSQAVEDLFKEKRISSEIKIRNVNKREVGKSLNHWQVNVVAEFEYPEFTGG